MVDPTHGQARPNAIVLLLVAMTSALVVVGVYEIRARLAKHPPEPGSSDLGASRESASGAQAGDPPGAARHDCPDLRRRYLAECPGDLPPAPPPPQAPPSQTGRRDDDARAASELAVWMNPPPEELSEMAKRCEVRFDMPAIAENEAPVVTDEASTALSLSDRERALLDRTLGDMHAALRDFAGRELAETGASLDAASAPTLEQMLTDLQSRPEAGFEEAREKLAAERAGLTPALARSARQPAGERLLRLWAGLGDDFEHRLTAELGGDRAHEFRVSSHASWMNRFSQAGCRSQPAAASR